MHQSTSRIFLTSLVSLFLLGASSPAHAAPSVAQRLAGRILLQVEQRGEAWYVDPVTRTRISLGGAEQAYTLMRTQGLGIRHAELQRYLTDRFPLRLAGRIVLDVEQHGEAYYVSPQTRTGTYLATAADAYTLMRRAGLGIRDTDLARIPVHPSSASVSVVTPAPTVPTVVAPSPHSDIEQAVWRRINEYRASKQLPPLLWNEAVANVAREHSSNMAAGTTSFSHDGFDDRYETLRRTISIGWMGENIASNTYQDPIEASVTGWINSDGHRANIERTTYTHTGIGVMQSSLDEYFLTQLFVSLR